MAEYVCVAYDCPMPKSTHNPDLGLAAECQHATEALSALLGCVDNGARRYETQRTRWCCGCFR